jgi:hypothetical protein
MTVLGFLNSIFDVDVVVWLLFGAVWVVFWVWQFVQLMMLEDRLFPGRFDKLVWGMVFVFLCPVAPVAFLVWKNVRLGEAAAARRKVEG